MVFCSSAADESEDSGAGFSGSLLGFGELTSAILLSSLLLGLLLGYEVLRPRSHDEIDL